MPEDMDMAENEDVFHWYEADDKENPFQIRILDCRPLTQNVCATTEDPTVAQNFLKLRDSKGEEHIGHAPENSVPLACHLQYPCQGAEQGPIYISPDMDYKWDIFHWDGHFYFVRSWTGALIYRAKIRFENNYLHVDCVEASDAQQGTLAARFAIRDIDFLIKSYILGYDVPHPIDPETASLDDEKVAMYSFVQYGKRALFASPDDTMSLTVEKILSFPSSMAQPTQS